MKKLLFYTYWKFDDAETNGITQKIISQKKAFEQLGYNVDLTYLLNDDYYIDMDGKKNVIQKKPPFITKPLAEEKLKKIVKYKKYDCAYFRYNCSDSRFISLLKCLKKNGTKVYIEIPTVEYDKELSETFLGKMFLAVDRMNRWKLKSYVDRMVVFQDYEEVFGTKTIKTYNGIDVDRIPVKKPTEESETINIISVALYQSWHGLERILLGLYDYYKNPTNRKIMLHVVGDGVALPGYETLVKELNLDKYVVFYGLKSGQELDSIFDKCDIAVEVLGGHKKGTTISSSIKSREYIARGIPYISEIKTDVLPEDNDYVIRVSYDDNPIDMNQVVEYFNSHLASQKQKEKVIMDMRKLAQDKINMKSTMRVVVDDF